MSDDPAITAQRLRRPSVGRALVAAAPTDAPPADAPAAAPDLLTLPAWPFRRRGDPTQPKHDNAARSGSSRPGNPGSGSLPTSSAAFSRPAVAPEHPDRQPPAIPPRPAIGLFDRSTQHAPRPPPRELRADRAAARYAPVGATFILDTVTLTVLTVSMSGISLHWPAGQPPPVGARLDGEIDTGPAGSVFAASMLVVRRDPDREAVAGRFAPLSGPAIDRLLTWLSQLDRAAAKV